MGPQDCGDPCGAVLRNSSSAETLPVACDITTEMTVIEGAGAPTHRVCDDRGSCEKLREEQKQQQKDRHILWPPFREILDPRRAGTACRRAWMGRGCWAECFRDFRGGLVGLAPLGGVPGAGPGFGGPGFGGVMGVDSASGRRYRWTLQPESAKMGRRWPDS